MPDKPKIYSFVMQKEIISNIKNTYALVIFFFFESLTSCNINIKWVEFATAFLMVLLGKPNALKIMTKEVIYVLTDTFLWT